MSVNMDCFTFYGMFVLYLKTFCLRKKITVEIKTLKIDVAFNNSKRHTRDRVFRRSTIIMTNKDYHES